MRGALAVALWTTLACAIVNLPVAHFPPVWIAALTVPALVLVALERVRRLHPWVRRIAVGLLQLATVLLALDLVGPLDNAPALACTLLPPLAYIAGRRGEADVPLALVFSVWVLLIGVLMREEPDVVWLGCYLLAAAVTLRLDAQVAVLADRYHQTVATESRWRAWSRTTLIATACGLTVLAVDHLLALVPSPASLTDDSKRDPSFADGGRQAGLGTSFDLDGPAGSPLHLRHDKLLRVRPLDGSSVSSRLYLRCSYFDIPGLDEWRVARRRHGSHDTTRSAWRVRRPLRRATPRLREIQLLATQPGFVFVPPGTYRIAGLGVLAGSPSLGWFAQAPGAGPATYEVRYQDLRPLASDRGTDPAFASLRRLPAELRRPDFKSLARELAGDARGPVALARAIRAGLGGRCTYRLREPTGPHTRPLLNFLYGDRAGYCMHFASAMAILLRHRGVPCRIGVGLFRGEADTEEPRARLFGSRHAHAWVEIPIRGLGWIVFEATPPAHLSGGPTVPGFEDLAAGADEGTLAASESENEIVSLLSKLAANWWFVIALAAVWLLLGLRPRRKPEAWQPAVPRTLRPARRLLTRILEHLAAAGLPRRPGQTLESYHASVLAAAQVDDAALADAFAAYQEVRFGERAWDDGHERRLQSGVEAAERCARAGRGLAT